MADTVQSLTPSGLEIAQCRLQSQFVVENCRARTECRTDVSTCIRAILGPYTGRFFQEKPLFQEKTTSKSFITRGRCNKGLICLFYFLVDRRPRIVKPARQLVSLKFLLALYNFLGSGLASPVPGRPSTRAPPEVALFSRDHQSLSLIHI